MTPIETLRYGVKSFEFCNYYTKFKLVLKKETLQRYYDDIFEMFKTVLKSFLSTIFLEKF